MNHSPGVLWGGRFSSGPSPQLFAISVSTQFDWRLASLDIEGSLAHAAALHRAGLLTRDQYDGLVAGLQRLLDDVESGCFVPADSDEDVHGALERGLVAIVGDELGGRLRAGRSRNDQIATLIRLYLKRASTDIEDALGTLIEALATQAEAHMTTIMPGRTHMQPAQPVLLAHHLLAHCWPLVRDIGRLRDLRRRLDECPYGSAALAGTSLGLDPGFVAEQLGFAGSVANSIDGTSARDTTAEFAYIAAQIGIDCSRLAEDIIIWCTPEFGFAKLGDSWSTGSSIMPQKKNPDIAELARGKAGRLIGDLTGLLSTLKAMPLAYDRDLQEDKEPIFDAVDTLGVLLPALTGLVATLQFDDARMRQAAGVGFALATDMADWLVKQGVPFAKAHDITGQAVRYCEARGIDLPDLDAKQLAEINPLLKPDVLGVLNLDASVESRDGRGGTAPARVAEQLAELRSII